MAPHWWQGFFDENYFRMWQASLARSRSRAEADGLWRILRLQDGSRVLDAPCGWGRIAIELARLGAAVTGVDQSAFLIEQAVGGRGDVEMERLRYRVHDLRDPLAESGFDAACNIFSSIGYGTEEDDMAIFRNLRNAVRPGGFVFVETMHRDFAAAAFSRGHRAASRLADGTLVIEEPVFDAIAGRVETTWHWWGPNGNGAKPASLRTYCVTELIALLGGAGLRFVSAHQGCSTEPFVATGPEMGGRLGLLTQRVED